MKRLLTGTALALLLAASPALAQQSPAPESSPSEQTTPPAAGAPSAAPESDDSMESPSAAAPESNAPTATTTSGDAQFVTAQQPGDWGASALIGQSVTNSANESVGEINDLIVDSSGKIIAAVVGVGGFLGIGERNVAVRYESMQVTRDDPNNMKVSLNVTKDTLQSAPEYKMAGSSDAAGGTSEEKK